MPNPCSNNGLCTQTTTGYICSCTYPFTGTNCQQSMCIFHMFLLIYLYYSISNKYNDNSNDYSCYTCTMWWWLRMYCNTMSNDCCNKSMFTKSMVCFLIDWSGKDFLYISFVYSQNQGGCAVQNNAAICWCANAYQGYYCQFRMLKIG